MLQTLRPKTESPYSKGADNIIEMYRTGEISNVKTAINLVAKLNSTRPQITASKIKEYLEIKKELAIKPATRSLILT
jgi:hypothetical protein